MSKYICKDCGIGLAVRPPRDCPSCGSGNIAIKTDSAHERPLVAHDEEYINKMIKHVLEDLAEKVCGGPYTEEFRNNQIERTIERIRPYLISEELRKEARHGIDI